jgi:hypothetical protein
MMNLKFDTESLTFSNVNKKPDKIQSKGKATSEDIDMIEDDWRDNILGQFFFIMYYQRLST